VARRLTARLHQVEGRRSARLFELFDDRFLRVRRQAGKGRRIEYAMDIAILAPEQRRTHVRPWHWLITAGACVALMSAATLYALFGTGHTVALSLLAVALLALTVAAAMQFVRDSRHLLTLYSRLAAVPLVEMLADRPEAPQVADFAERLIRCINDTVSDKALSPEDLRAGELRTLRKLAENRAIDLTTYEQAKQRLLSLTL